MVGLPIAVVRPYLVGEDIADEPNQTASRWIIDFGTISLEEATNRYPRALGVSPSAGEASPRHRTPKGPSRSLVEVR